MECFDTEEVRGSIPLVPTIFSPLIFFGMVQIMLNKIILAL
jgi:hypothetical protein